MATYILHGNKTGDNVTYTCDRNYKINGTATNTTNATCGFDDDYIGVWLNVPSCEGWYKVLFKISNLAIQSPTPKALFLAGVPLLFFHFSCNLP